MLLYRLVKGLHFKKELGYIFKLPVHSVPDPIAKDFSAI
jgi:hypothetical protein